jgi:hypothetical protein
MITRHRARAALSLTSLALLASACGGGSNGAHPVTSSKSAAPVVSATDAAGDANYTVSFPGPATHRLVHPKDAQGAALAATSAKVGAVEYDVFDLSPASLTAGKELEGLTYEAKKFYSNFACTITTSNGPALSGHPTIAFTGKCGGRSVLGFIVDSKAHLYFVDVESAPGTAVPTQGAAFLGSFALRD